MSQSANTSGRMILLLGGEYAENALDCLHGVGGVQCGQHEMAGFGGGEGGGDRIEVAHLADSDHIRILPQDVNQRLLVASIKRRHETDDSDGQTESS